jgi:DNA-binding CsgD family transcriptional regulator
MGRSGGQEVQEQLMVRIDLILLTRVLPDLIESDVRKGDRKMLGAALGRLARHAEMIKTPLAAALLARSEALAATGPEAEAGFIEAIELLSNPKMSFELAKTQLLFGEWLRRQGRRRDARSQLQAAYEELDALGIDHLAERAKIELAATGERARRRTYDTQDDLTPQEAQVARMAAQGARNTEIGNRLFISPATVEYHLSKVYRKLGIDSRAKLVRSMLLADSHEEQEAQALTG